MGIYSDVDGGNGAPGDMAANGGHHPLSTIWSKQPNNIASTNTDRAQAPCQGAGVGDEGVVAHAVTTTLHYRHLVSIPSGGVHA